MCFGSFVHRVVRITETNETAKFDIRSEAEGNVYRRNVIEFQNGQRQLRFESASESDLSFKRYGYADFVFGGGSQKFELFEHNGFSVVAHGFFAVCEGGRFNVVVGKFHV